jgi:hypothetical protein
LRTPVRFTLPAVIGVSVLALSISLAGSARADVAIAGDIDYAAPVDSSVDAGPGFGLRLGYHAHIPFVILTPELGFSYYGFQGDYPANMYRGVAGMRLAIGEIIRPGVFAHIGVAQLQADGPPPDPSHSALTYDAGLFLDFTLLPLVNIGGHAAYNRMEGSDEASAVNWATVGAHAEIVF